ncbi:MAG: acyl-CoA dehydrogenase family protein [Deltaproteobacteria bacterium]|nr:acyl-CoA dehydrogenase family protein [Deltaproteobacteria bacterium]
MDFIQAPPQLGNQYDDDPLLQEYLSRVLPKDMLGSIERELHELGELGGITFFKRQLEDRLNEPTLTQFAPFGERIDQIELSPLWREAQRVAAERGLVALAYERRNGEHSRVHQFALNYLVQASLDVYSCPLAMTDGAARTLVELGNHELADRALPRLTSRDPSRMWTSGQWMTERIGGSDVGRSEAIARLGAGGWRLHGTKWFCSAATSEMALTLARPEGNKDGGRGLALFYVETRDPKGGMNGIQIHRLKDKMGTRKLPTAELRLDGTLAKPVAGLQDGVKNITFMLNITRTWNAFGAAWGMRRAVALVRDWARRREAFGARLADKPLFADTVAGIAAETEGAFHLAFRAAELLGRHEAGVATEQENRVARILTPLAKLTTGKQAVAVASEALECFGGAGVVEDTGLPLLLRDTHVLPIWEGTTDVLSLDALRALAADGTFQAFVYEVQSRLAMARDAALGSCVGSARSALDHASQWLSIHVAQRGLLEQGARRFAMTLGRTAELAYLVAHAQWCLDHGHGKRALAAARRFSQSGVDLINAAVDGEDSRLLA